MKVSLAILIGLLLSATAAHAQQTTSTAENAAVTTSTEIKPVLAGEQAPDAIVFDADGNRVNLVDIYSSGPTMLIFYRGGWCPYCNTHLGKLAEAESKIKALGYQIYAISPDSPEHLKDTAEKTAGKYQLLSDSSANAINAFGLAFRVDDQIYQKYITYKIDLEVWAGGESHHLLPVPAAYLIDKTGKVKYQYHHTDYKNRVDVETLLEEAAK